MSISARRHFGCVGIASIQAQSTWCYWLRDGVCPPVCSACWLRSPASVACAWRAPDIRDTHRSSRARSTRGPASGWRPQLGARAVAAAPMLEAPCGGNGCMLAECRATTSCKLMLLTHQLWACCHRIHLGSLPKESVVRHLVSSGFRPCGIVPSSGFWWQSEFVSCVAVSADGRHIHPLVRALARRSSRRSCSATPRRLAP